MWARLMNLVHAVSDALDSLRPCKRAVAAIEVNVAVTRQLSDSISRLNETLSGCQKPRRRSSDPEGDESWRRRGGAST